MQIKDVDIRSAYKVNGRVVSTIETNPSSGEVRIMWLDDSLTQVDEWVPVEQLQPLNEVAA